MNGIVRTKLANILIRAGFNRAKCLRAVNYPYYVSIDISHTAYQFSNKFLEFNGGFYRCAKFTYLNDTDYRYQPEENRIRCFATNGDKLNPAFSSKVKLIYNFRYPRSNDIFTEFDEFGADRTIARVGYILGVQTGVIKKPTGWGIPEMA
jgi:hypothetical protein